MKQTAADIVRKKRQILIERTATALGVDGAEAMSLLSLGRRQSIRLNPLVGDRQVVLDAMRELGWQGEQYGWLSDGYTVEAGLELLRDSRLAEAGQLYIQNAASWLPVVALDPQPGDKILDVCAAPGGKTAHIAALTANQAQITANDNSRARLMRLQANCRRLGADIERFTLYDARQLVRKLDGQSFDRILIDAPCSGEGLMRLDRDKDFETWSVAHIRRLQQLQRRLLVQAWQLLEPGGTLVYSTCTMAPEENEAVIDYGLRALSGVSLMSLDNDLPNRVPAVQTWNGRNFNQAIQGCLRLKPSLDIEAFFVCKLIKSTTADSDRF